MAGWSRVNVSGVPEIPAFAHASVAGDHVYVAGMLRVLGVRPVPFVLSFTIYFIALHMTEALFMRRLFLRAEAH